MKKVLLSMLLALGFCACEASEPVQLKGKNFVLLPQKEITLSFDKEEDRFFGKAVNNYFGSYKQDKTALAFNPGGMTMMMGPEDKMKAERQYMNDLAKVTTATMKGKKLILTGEGVTLTFEEQ